MKKIINYLGIIAASAFAFSACQKELTEVNYVTVSFTAEKINTESKTAVVEGGSFASYEWTTEDVGNIKLFTVEGGSIKAEVASPTITKNSATSLTISTTVPENSTTTFRAILCKPANYTGEGNNYTSRKPKVAGTQAPNGMAGYDPEADILVSDDLDVTVGTGEDVTGEMNMVFRRKVVINKMTLKNMVEGEKVSKVVITSDKNLTGYLNGEAMTGDRKTITLNYDDIAVPAGGQFPVYFVTMENTGQMLSIEVTTDQYIYTKAFASSIDLNLGEFTRFGVGLPAGVPNTTLSLPINDSMTWADNGLSESNEELVSSDLTDIKKGELKIYSTATKAYKGIGGLKLGSSSVVGSITTNDIDLSSAFYVAIDAKVYSTDGSFIQILVNGSEVYTSTALSSDYETYYVNCPAATSKSNVTISSVKGSKPRAYIKNLRIGAGEYVLPPSIDVTSANPIGVANTANSPTISYSINNPNGSSLTAALKNPSDTWISNIDCNTPGEVTFNVAAQEDGATARSAVIVLSYTGASNVEVTVNQAAGDGGKTEHTATLTIRSVSSLGATYDDDQGNTWNASSDAQGFTSNTSYLHAGSGNKTVSHVTLSTTAYSSADIKEVHVWAAAAASSGATTKIKIGGNLLGESGELSNTASSGGTEYYVVNSTPYSGTIEVVISRASATKKAIYFNQLTVVYEE